LFGVYKPESRIWFFGMRIDVAEKQKHLRSKTGFARSKNCRNEIVAKGETGETVTCGAETEPAVLDSKVFPYCS
jgi:hypothetical protein